jgi:hypothetical protein
MMSRSSIRSALVGLTLTGALVACGGGNGDAPKDAAGPDTLCGANDAFTGETIDFDANAQVFCGVFKATVSISATTSQATDITNPNGRFNLCMPHQQTVVAITPPTDPSQCVTGSPTYSKSGVLVLAPEVIAANALASVRLISNDRVSTMYDAKTMAYNASAAQVVVHLTGPAHPVTISTPDHAPTQQFDGTAWAAAPSVGATTGTEILFPNVDMGTGTVMISVDGGTPASVTLSTATNTLAPDKFTYVTVITH